ncbi:MAG: hypothetical protein JXO44_07920 [Clostridia bacterium]|nr:hypothetical protein [Clostridia bacterium]
MTYTKHDREEVNTLKRWLNVDFLATQDNVDPERIAIIGICGWGGMALNAAAIDIRVTANGYFDSTSVEERYRMRTQLNAQRTEDYKAGSYARVGSLPEAVPEEAPFFLKDYVNYYKTARGYHKNSVYSNNGWNVTYALPFMNMLILQYSHEIRNAVIMIHVDLYENMDVIPFDKIGDDGYQFIVDISFYKLEDQGENYE